MQNKELVREFSGNSGLIFQIFTAVARKFRKRQKLFAEVFRNFERISSDFQENKNNFQRENVRLLAYLAIPIILQDVYSADLWSLRRTSEVSGEDIGLALKSIAACSVPVVSRQPQVRLVFCPDWVGAPTVLRCCNLRTEYQLHFASTWYQEP